MKLVPVVAEPRNNSTVARCMAPPLDDSVKSMLPVECQNTGRSTREYSYHRHRSVQLPA